VTGLYVDAYPDALRIARRVLGAAEADDVVQAAVVVMLRRRHTLTHASPQCFYKVVKNLALDWRAQRQRVDYVGEEMLALLDAQRQRDVRGHRVAPPPRRHDGTPSG